MAGMTVLEGSSSLPTAISPFSPLLAKVITVSIHVNRMARQLERNTGKYPTGGSQTATVRCCRSQVIGILSMASVKLFSAHLHTIIMYCFQIKLCNSEKDNLEKRHENGEDRRGKTHKQAHTQNSPSSYCTCSHNYSVCINEYKDTEKR